MGAVRMSVGACRRSGPQEKVFGSQSTASSLSAAARIPICSAIAGNDIWRQKASANAFTSVT